MGLPGESTAPTGPSFNFSPRNFREMIQRQIGRTVDKEVSSLSSFTIGNFDGRFLGNFPGTTQQLQNTDGKYYHIVGLSRGGDKSVAAP